MKYTKKELIKILKQLNLSYVSKSFIDGNENLPSSSTFVRAFGSWSGALESADLNVGRITGRPQDIEIEVSKQAIDIINGELLGDGSLYLSGSYRSNACFSHSTANFHYGQYLYDKLNKLNVPLLPSETLPARNSSKPQFRTRTKTNKYWTKLWSKWYINGQKCVPRDLILTKESCLHWYLGDGYLEKAVKFSTCNFSIEDISFLVGLLGHCGFKASANKRSGGYYVIRIFKKDSFDFLEWIGDCPTKRYEHKWRL